MKIFGIKADNEIKRNKRQNASDSFSAFLTSSCISSGIASLSLENVRILHKLGKLPQDKIDLLHNAAEKALDISGISKKGVSIEYLSPENKKGYFTTLFSSPIEQIKQGYNASFIKGKNIFGKPIYQILMPKNDISFAAFHEIGHSINHFNSKFWKSMQKIGAPAKALASFITLYGTFSKKSEAPEGQELNKKQKANNFIRNNAGKLSLALMLPTLAEEAMASIRGQKLANKLLPPKMAKQVLKNNILAYTSYIIGAASITIGSYAAVKIKDKLTEKHNNKTSA